MYYHKNSPPTVLNKTDKVKISLHWKFIGILGNCFLSIFYCIYSRKRSICKVTKLSVDFMKLFKEVKLYSFCASRDPIPGFPNNKLFNWNRTPVERRNTVRCLWRCCNTMRLKNRWAYHRLTLAISN